MNPFREGILNALFSGAIKQGEEPVALSRVPVNMRTDGDKIVIEFEPGNVPGHIVEWYDEAMLSRL